MIIDIIIHLSLSQEEEYYLKMNLIILLQLTFYLSGLHALLLLQMQMLDSLIAKPFLQLDPHVYVILESTTLSKVRQLVFQLPIVISESNE